MAATFGVLNAYFISWRKEIFLVTAVLPEVLTGEVCTTANGFT